MKKIGMTTTIPVEAIVAAGHTPVDLNNIFINDPNPGALVTSAEYDGYPRSACGWIKGMYTLAATGAPVLGEGGIDALVAVVEGDCTQTQAMVETLRQGGLNIIPFSYPYGRDKNLLRMQIDKLIQAVGTTWEEAEKCKARLDGIRRKVRKLDELTWQRGALSSLENHYYQICCSDFNGDVDTYEQVIDDRLEKALKHEKSDGSALRLGYIGVPTIFTDFYDVIEDMGATVVFNEVQRQFAMPYETADLIEQYSVYTYPYDVFARIEDIKREVERRSIRGLIHYTQSFCFRQIQDIIIRKHIDVPILTIEGDSPIPVDARTRVRMESFIEMLE
ncbi:MAG: 2-hydroxyacyl-CoA dehydratase family protein [Armatimonadota bacterium]|jgi:benzoyl-CoA reductase/2-hydroxyglutaryl-CoA dehydratase subunit BcrC/BadD/HgdB